MRKPASGDFGFWGIWAGGFLLAAGPGAANAAPAPGGSGALTVQGYLDQVSGRSPLVRGSAETELGGRLRADEAGLLTLPSFFADVNVSVDQRPQTIPIVTYSAIKNQTYSLGVAEQFDFGLTARLSYNVSHTQYDDYNLPFPVSGVFLQSSYYEVTPRLELSQSFWSNGFGRGTRAQKEGLRAQALASSHAASYQTAISLVQAENAYWRLAFARSLIEVQRGALERAQKIQDWTGRQARLSLADRSDALQAQANGDLRRLELQASVDEERSARLAFNLARGSTEAEVPETLQGADPDHVLATPAPVRGPALRADVAAAEQQSLAVEANAAASSERDLPQLDVFASYQFYGRDAAYGSASGDSLSQNINTRAVGLRFSVPIDVSAATRAREGWVREKAGAELSYRQKLLEQEADWSDLVKRLAEAKTRLGLTLQLERTQEAKLGREKERLRGGRSTTFQVLTFEQDFALSQVNRIRAESDVIATLTQMRVFADPAGLAAPRSTQ